MVDLVVHRHDLRDVISRLCLLLGAEAAPETLPVPAEPATA
jgi:hypothetical protein